MSRSASEPAVATAPLFVADDVALDFINTKYGTGPQPAECLYSDQAVLDWLATAGLLNDFQGPPRAGRPGALLRSALELRSEALELVERRKIGSSADVTILNRMLAAGGAHTQLLWKRGRAPELHQVRSATTPEALLAPLAEAFAKLLAEGDFELIRKCESETCTLWFYDRTKSHRRRWCDMAVCGNRAKAAAFRERQRSG